MVLNGISFEEMVFIRIRTGIPAGRFRVGLRRLVGIRTIEYINWSCLLAPVYLAMAYADIELPFAGAFVYTPGVDEEMATHGLKAWVLDYVLLEELIPM